MFRLGFHNLLLYPCGAEKQTMDHFINHCSTKHLPDRDFYTLPIMRWDFYAPGLLGAGTLDARGKKKFFKKKF